MTDKTTIKLDLKSKFGYRLHVYNWNNSRGWIDIYDPNGFKIISSPIQTYFVYLPKFGFVKSIWSISGRRLPENKLKKITKRDILSLRIIKQFGF